MADLVDLDSIVDVFLEETIKEEKNNQSRKKQSKQKKTVKTEKNYKQLEIEYIEEYVNSVLDEEKFVCCYLFCRDRTEHDKLVDFLKTMETLNQQRNGKSLFENKDILLKICMLSRNANTRNFVVEIILNLPSRESLSKIRPILLEFSRTRTDIDEELFTMLL